MCGDYLSNQLIHTVNFHVSYAFSVVHSDYYRELIGKNGPIRVNMVTQAEIHTKKINAWTSTT
jgi:hypothetical protein